MKKNTVIANATLMATTLAQLMNCNIRVQFSFHKVGDSVYPIAQFQKFFYQCGPLRPHWSTISSLAIGCLVDKPHPLFKDSACPVVGHKASKY